MSESDNTAPMLTVVIDGQPHLEYDRSKPLPAHQLAYLDRMDEKMDEGIAVDGETVDNPDRLQRAQFVALHLLEAVQAGEDGWIAASCAYLAQRLPDLQQVKASLSGGVVSAELVFDEPYTHEVAVEFSPRLS